MQAKLEKQWAPENFVGLVHLIYNAVGVMDLEN